MSTDQQSVQSAGTTPQRVLAVLYENMTQLDFTGPLSVFQLSNRSNPDSPTPANYYSVSTISQNGKITSLEGLQVTTNYSFSDPVPQYDIFLIPGAVGATIDALASNGPFIEKIKELANASPFVFTVCTGSPLLATTGLLDGKSATSNKLAWAWITNAQLHPLWSKVNWIEPKRWVQDGKYLSSGGISAGIDAALFLVSEQYGVDIAKQTASFMEYDWDSDPNHWKFQGDK